MGAATVSGPAQPSSPPVHMVASEAPADAAANCPPEVAALAAPKGRRVCPAGKPEGATGDKHDH